MLVITTESRSAAGRRRKLKQKEILEKFNFSRILRISVQDKNEFFSVFFYPGRKFSKVILPEENNLSFNDSIKFNLNHA